MERKITVMSAEEVLGSMILVLDEYPDLMERIKKNVEDEDGYNLGEILAQYYYDGNEIENIEMLNTQTVRFLNLPENRSWFISTWRHEYVENL